MDNSIEHLLLYEVQPGLRAALAHAVPLVGAEDRRGLMQDGLAVVVRFLPSAQRSGKQVTPGNLALYTVKSLRPGRRSTGGGKTDTLSPTPG